MAKTTRISKAAKQQQAIDDAVARALAKHTPAPASSLVPVDPAVASKSAREISAVHEAARVARRGGAPADVVEQLEATAIELEKAARG